MGRPKGSKNKKTLEKERLEREVLEKEIEIETNTEEEILTENPTESLTENPTEENKKRKNKNKENKILCERCGKEIYSEPRKIDTNMLTGMADYYRESRRYVRLCDECCKELSKIVDEWLWMKEKGGNEELRKFEV